ncbi:SDR family oxidoreductase (plasmid) [Agrobacterium leguminum]|uniref:Short-chain dehydrogenase/reductase SDR n=1 Tax=Agrobacterium deltaense NCPPB 1641 TaxID=1183425 RepID=A0A1S7UB86_9HYPH|nr:MULTISPECIES: SDR family oxidoreductase [Agrobacterium]WFS69764.1 SDR family oxidoreductase [Agrobacterium leguminum]CVI64075.1 Short-chain dehydrogenase/reductase SDR [Agrobacterium deltaense NCPPB 1641]
MSKRLEGRVAVVAGAGSIASGMSNGRASSITYAREGAKVVAVDLNEASAEETRKMIIDEGGECVAFAADMSNSSDVQVMVDFAVKSFGTIDLLHNNIGIVKTGGALDTSEEDWDRIVSVNLKSMFLGCKYVIPVMEQQKRGVIINVGSMAALRWTGAPMLAYATTKAAVPSFTRTIAMQFAGSGIRANCIHPGVIDTPLNNATAASYGETFKVDMAALRARREATIPLGKYGTAWDIANAALFLASDESQYITGTELVVDGGFIQRSGG